MLYSTESMSGQHFIEEIKTDASKNLPFVSKCLAIVLIPKSRSNSLDNLENNKADETIDQTNGNVQSVEAEKAVSSSGCSGKDLLQDFKIRNKTCYWNPSLVESIKSLEYKGFVEPSTILVTAADIHLENLRSAWGRRILKAPKGFIIERIGDVNGIQMQIIPQTQFMALSDALCSIIIDLNLRHIVATLDIILERLAVWYKDMTVPSHHQVFETLGTLIKDRKVFHTGTGYFVVTPEMGQPQNSVNTSYVPTNASWLPYHPMYVPVFQGQLPSLSSRAIMRSISCQVTTIEESSEEESDADKKTVMDGKSGAAGQASVPDKLDKLDDKDSKTGKTDNKTETVNAEFKMPLPKSKGYKIKTLKDADLKSSTGSHEKEKGEKTSLFSKLFNRKKKDKDKDRVLMPPPPPSTRPPSVTTTTSTGSSEALCEEKGEKEYATFSAQFPPLEWVWYQQQLEKHKRTETWISQQSMSLVNSHHPPKITSRPPVGKKPEAPDENRQHMSRKPTVQPDNGYSDYMPMSAVSSLDGKDSRIPNQDDDRGFIKPQTARPENIYESFSTASSLRPYHYKLKPQDTDRPHYQRSSEYSVIGPSDVTPINSSNIYQSISALSPVAKLLEESTYAKLVAQHQLGPYHSTPLCERQSDRTTYKVDGQEARDRIYGPQDKYHRRKSHRSYRRRQRMYSFYSSQCSDISYEYKGCLPNKNSSQVQSRDSGVNCVGLGVALEQGKKGPDPLYENTAAKYHKHYYHHNSQHQNANSDHYHFTSNLKGKTTGKDNTQLNHLNITDSVTNSVAYESNITNGAYNSVVYGSATDMTAEPSAFSQTHLEPSELPVPQNSLHSAFYEESNMGAALHHGVSSKINLNTHRGFRERPSSPETVIVDVVGSSSDEESCDSAEDILESPHDRRGKGRGVVIEGSPPSSSRCRPRHRRMETADYAEACDGNDESTDHCYECNRIPANKQGISNGSDFLGLGKPDKSSESVTAPRLKRTEFISGKGNFVLDSGFSSPWNPENIGSRDSNSNHSNSTREISGGSNQDCNSCSEGKHQFTTSSNTHQPSTKGSGGPPNHGGTSRAPVHELQSGSSSDRGAFSEGHCEQKTLPKPTSKVKHASSLNSLNPHNHLQQFQPSVHHHHHHQHYQNMATLSHQTARLKDHHDLKKNATGTTCKDQNSAFRVPLHPNSHHSIRKSHHSSRPKHGRSHESDLWKSSLPDELHKFEQKELSKKYGLSEEFMGVL